MSYFLYKFQKTKKLTMNFLFLFLWCHEHRADAPVAGHMWEYIIGIEIEKGSVVVFLFVLSLALCVCVRRADV